jgi:uncharacterized phage protein gp47/JayE
MAIPQIPTIEQIKDRIVSDIEIKLNQTIPLLPLAFIKVLASAIAGMMFLLYQAILWVYKQIFPATADYSNLVLLGAIVGITPLPAVSAILLATIPGTGTDVSAGTLFIGSNGITYRVTTTTTITAGFALNVPLLALTSGEIGNLANGEILNITTTDLNLTGTATITGTQTSGADAESQESFSARVSIRYRTRYITGSPGAHAINGLETPHFIWVGPYEDALLPGVINVYGRVDNQTEGIPTAGQLVELLSYLTYDPTTGKQVRRVMGITLNCLPITVRAFEIDIYISDGNGTLSATIEAAVEEYATTLEPYIQGVSDSRKNVLTNTDAAGVADAVAVASDAKVANVVITDTVTGLTETNYTLYGGQFVKFSTVTFIPVV